MMAQLLKRTSLLLLLACSLGQLNAPVSAQALSATKDEIAYRVRPGDSLIALGRKFFVSPESYKQVQRLNSLENPDSLRVGATIVIPISVLRYSRLEARIIAFKGRASVTRDARSEAVSLQTRLSEGAVIETAADGYLTMQLANGSKIAIPSNSQLRIARMRTYLLSGGTDLDFMVERGRSEITATRLPDSRSRFRMRTPVAVSAVRGTVFRIGYDGAGSPTLTEVVEGHVAVNLNAGAAQTSLATGFGAAGSPDGRLQREALLPPPEFVEPGRVQRGREVAFALRANPIAIGYHVQIARDRGFVDIVTAGRSPTPLVNIGSLPPGRYFARATAIAPSGLEGLPQTLPFERKLEALAAHKLPGDGRRWQLEWDLGGGDRPVFHLQVVSAADPALPIIDEPGLSGNSMTVQGLSAGRYSWRVGELRTIDGKVQQYWTEPESFTVER